VLFTKYLYIFIYRHNGDGTFQNDEAAVCSAVRPVRNTNTIFRNLTTQTNKQTNKISPSLRVHLSSVTSVGHFANHQVDFTSTYMEKDTEMEVTVNTLKYIILNT